MEVPSLKPVDFSGFDFEKSQGEYKDTLAFVNHPKLKRRLFVLPMDDDNFNGFSVMPVCHNKGTSKQKYFELNFFLWKMDILNSSGFYLAYVMCPQNFMIEYYAWFSILT